MESIVNRTRSLFWIALFSLVTASALAQNNAVPLVNQPLSPTSVPPGHRAFALNITGTGFAPGAVVNWNGVPRGTVFISSSHLQAAITAADVARMGTALVTVVNPAPGGGTSNFVYFPVGIRSSTVSFVSKEIPFGFGVSAIAAADFNNDGSLDLAIANGSTMEVLPGNGDGTFQSPVSTNLDFVNDSGLTCGSINSLVVGDFNNDGKTDLAVGYSCAPFSGSSISLLYMALGTGDGHFVAVGNGTISGGPLATADLNADGSLDVVTTNCDYTCANWYPAVNLGTGGGLFASGISLGDTYGFGVGAFGDFNHDGRLDLALPGGDFNQQPLNLYAFPGNGDGTFQSPALYSLSGRGFNAGTAAVADLNGDGNLDVAIDGVTVLLGNGTGAFTNIGGPTISNSGGIQLADFNNDGKLDAALFGTDLQNAVVTTLLGNGDGTFQNLQTWTTPGIGRFLAIGDFNGDGRLDFISAGTDPSENSTISLFLQSTLYPRPGSISFGAVKIGSHSLPYSTYFINIGSTTLTLEHIHLVGGGSNYYASNDCASTLAPGANCKVTIVFGPKSTGTINASLDVTYGGGIGHLQTVAITGTGD